MHLQTNHRQNCIAKCYRISGLISTKECADISKTRNKLQGHTSKKCLKMANLNFLL